MSMRICGTQCANEYISDSRVRALTAPTALAAAAPKRSC